MKKFEIELLRNLEKIAVSLGQCALNGIASNVKDPDDLKYLAKLFQQQYDNIDHEYDSMEPEDVP